MVAANKQLDSFDGKMDEVQAFDEALTDAQVYALYISKTGGIIDYDKAGNMLSDKDGYLYTYDYENRIIDISIGDGDATPTQLATFEYDALGRRISKFDSTVSGDPLDQTMLYYYNSNWQVLAEYDGAGYFKRSFVYGNYIDEVLTMNDGTADFYYAHNHLFSVCALLDDTGSIAERYEYNAYGEVAVYTDSDNDGNWFDDPGDTTYTASQNGNPYTFTGRRLDSLDMNQLRIIHSRNRYYIPKIGRFTSNDPLNYASSTNLYQYVKSAPLMWSDPFGYIETDIGVAKGAYAGLGFSMSLTASDTAEGCCDSSGNWLSEGMVEQSIEVKARVGIGMGAKFEIMGRYADLMWEGPGFEFAFGGTNSNETCGGPLGCMSICGSVGIDLGHTIEVGTGPLKVSMCQGALKIGQ